jgi:hypothetical protein
MVKEVLESMQLSNHGSMVSIGPVPEFCVNWLEGCAMILARSFARIHETNLKVSFSNHFEGDKN